MNRKVRASFWITEAGKRILARAAAEVGMSQGAYIEAAVREKATREKERRGP